MDDNTITMDSLNTAQAKLVELVEEHCVELDISNYDSAILKAF
ncbi:hypothetical protein VIA_001096 [Vibrio orientalis CIP 102891 = ATCC 33934]|uniref:Uncharacterized protein n=1 Tax=Vibrio orientalis CIP 102891 = ATCC 33934 TaxID=675816 RepID=A0ABP2H4G5_VIBOR|nr:hypothetical protein VIA_001096 [Vibrio orientalis CIP 102891 = ATCC 33934]